MYVSSGSAENRHLQAAMAAFGSGSKAGASGFRGGGGMRAARIAAIGLAIGLAVAAMTPSAPAWAGPAPATAVFGHSRVDIVTSDGVRRRFTVEVATSPAQREQGLMFRRHLAADAGMLFIFRHSRPVIMWMKHTLIPLDMVFIGADGRIAGMAQRTIPESLSLIPSPGPVLAVLEVRAGTAARLGLGPGDRVICPLLKVPGGAGR